MSVNRVACNLAHALRVATSDLPVSHALTLPALHVSMAQLIDAIARIARVSRHCVRYVPDARLEAQFGGYPPLGATAARALGFANDGNLDSLVGTILSTSSRRTINETRDDHQP